MILQTTTTQLRPKNKLPLYVLYVRSTVAAEFGLAAVPDLVSVADKEKIVSSDIRDDLDPAFNLFENFKSA